VALEEMAALAPAPEEVAEGAASSDRVLAQSYAAPQHAPNYKQPWGGCVPRHGPTFAPSWDLYGQCDWHGGGGVIRHQPAGCGPCGDACGGGAACANACGCGACDSCGDYLGGGLCNQTLVWAKFDVLLWWRQGRDLPPLVTTDPATESPLQAGVLPDAQILFGDGRVSSDMQAGGRVDLGTWTDLRQCIGVGWRFFGLGDDSTEFNITSLQNPVLAIPFTDVTNGNDALLVAFPGLRSGQVNFSASSNVIGNDVYARFLICRDHDSRLDFLTGWHYSRIEDSIQLRSRVTITDTTSVDFGTVTNVSDRFDARNSFNGGILGLLWERQCGCWSTTALARMALGNMSERVTINGATQITRPTGQNQSSNTGLFAASSNIGTYSRDEFTAVTEVGLTLGYRWGRCTQLTVGYTFIYWNDVVAAADAINPTLGTSAGGQQQPQFSFEHSDYWVQGLNLGFVREF
jgi:hypothetical protein